METQATLVGTEGRVELHAVASVDLEISLVVFPHYSELDDALGDRGDTESCSVLWVLLEQGATHEGAGELWMTGLIRHNVRDCLQAERLTMVSLLKLGLRSKVGHGEGE